MRNVLTNHKVLLVVVAVLLAINVGLLWYGFGDKRSGRGRSSRNFSVEQYMRKQIGFDDMQAEQFKLHLEKNRDSLKVYGDRVRDAKVALYKLLQGAPVADSVVERAAARLAEEQKAMEILMYRHFEAVRLMCKPDQLGRYDSMLTRMSSRNRWFNRARSGRDSVNENKNR